MPEEIPEMYRMLYLEAISLLMRCATVTRPDIAFPVSLFDSWRIQGRFTGRL
jgi:hypothetical protein